MKSEISLIGILSTCTTNISINNIILIFGKNYTFGDLNSAIDQFLLQEKRMAKLNEKKLAHTTRQTIYEVLLNKQMELKSI